MKQLLEKNENKLIGKWINKNGKLVADGNSARITYLTQHALNEIGVSKDGWDVLYIDPIDGRYWELIYPDSEQHGGGAPMLIMIAPDEARKKYNMSLPTRLQLNSTS